VDICQLASLTCFATVCGPLNETIAMWSCIHVPIQSWLNSCQLESILLWVGEVGIHKYFKKINHDFKITF